MKKIPTIFVRDWDGTIGPPARFVLDEHHPDCEWVFAGEGVATRKYDGTCVMIRDKKRFKRLEVRGDKTPPVDFEEVQLDEETGKRVGWVPVGDGPEDKWHREAVFFRVPKDSDWDLGKDGTYELVGPKIQGNSENYERLCLIRHDTWATDTYVDAPTDYDALKAWLAERDIEGLVWHHPDGRMGKIKKKDFGLARKPE